MGKLFSRERFDDVPVVGILRNFPRSQIEMLAEKYYTAGLTTLEITMNSPEALPTISSLVKKFGGRLNIGAGTVCTKKDLDKALDAGACFIVTPVLDKTVIRACMKKKIPVFPGAYTPTEIYKAWSLGATMVKVFPATDLGPGYIKEVLAPLDKLALLPVGGVDTENFTAFLRAGAKGVGMGSHLFPRDLIGNGRWDELGEHFANFVRAVRDHQSFI
ncbi:MAG TPA: bifunctional 4-hydroxy-2-oxoglutarate aldolase/2-dehydro-3-deoxy-phosphogluconate aldolase [Puia sp.]|nr:bifunctional 4-hydroxy-2-oxoglutarate aldolase/2-dehydro-3-deoxy-phosphogluconate aldolase [Puia sp.]